MPGFLEESAYPYVEHLMVDSEGHQANFGSSVMNLLSEGNTFFDQETLNGRLHSYMDEYRGDTSFSQQMHEIMTSNRLPPDVILATQRSAVPVLDAVEGYCAELDICLPVLETIDVSRESVGRFYKTTSEIREEQKKKAEYEIGRLSGILPGAKVAIIDEFCSTGSALWQAGYIAENAGATEIAGIVGYWYRKIPQQLPNNPEVIRETYRDFMFKIGQLAAQTPKQTKK